MSRPSQPGVKVEEEEERELVHREAVPTDTHATADPNANASANVGIQNPIESRSPLHSDYLSINSS